MLTNNIFMKVLITGGSGFIGSFAILKFVNNNHDVINIDSLTYAGDNSRLEEIKHKKNYKFIKIDINNKKIKKIFEKFKPDCLINFAAESHVDNSIKHPNKFIETNINGVFNLLKISLDYLKNNKKFFFYQISTDEVFGSIYKNSFNLKSPYKPNSPYAASKASADLLVRSWNKTYGLPIIISYCSNNYGPKQHSEKFIPKIITNTFQHKNIPVYGNGKNVRDWIYVEDHADAIYKIALAKKINIRYFIGGNETKSNLDIIDKIFSLISKNKIEKKKLKKLINFTKDRLGHDLRYSVSISKNLKEIGWKKNTSLTKGLQKTIEWYERNSKI